jgi:hypothetical protein
MQQIVEHLNFVLLLCIDQQACKSFLLLWFVKLFRTLLLFYNPHYIKPYFMANFLKLLYHQQNTIWQYPLLFGCCYDLITMALEKVHYTSLLSICCCNFVYFVWDKNYKNDVKQILQFLGCYIECIIHKKPWNQKLSKLFCALYVPVMEHRAAQKSPTFSYGSLSIKLTKMVDWT